MSAERKDDKGTKKPDPKRPPDGGQQQQHQGGTGQQYGEGSYSGTRQYNEGVKDHMQHHDIEREARDAEPRTAAEEEEIERAERIGRSKSRGEGATPDGNAANDSADSESERDPER
jgi:hypothetical protein